MKNLAGNKDCDHCIRSELVQAGIELTQIDRTRHEVPSSVGGRIVCDGNEIMLYRAWYYWVASGPVPLELARKMYSGPVGVNDVRVAGHCGCPPPDEWQHDGFINTYHIDSQEGLNLFAQSIREWNARGPSDV